MRKILAISTIMLLAACSQSEAKNMAMTECGKQVESLPPAVDADEFCACVTNGISDSASAEETLAAVESNTKVCREQAIEKMVGGA